MAADRIPFLADLSAEFRNLYHTNNLANDFLLRSPGGIFSSNNSQQQQQQQQHHASSVANHQQNHHSSHHQVIPAKIVNYSVSPKGIRFYKIQWQETWLAEHTIVQYANHQNLIESYWLQESEKVTSKHQKAVISQQHNIKKSSIKNVNSPSCTKVTLPQQQQQQHVFSLANTLTTVNNSSTEQYSITTSLPQTIVSQGIAPQVITSSLQLPLQIPNELSTITSTSSISTFTVDHTVQSRSKVNALSKFSTLAESRKRKISINMETFDLVNIENFNVTEEELKATALDTLSSFKKKRVRFPNGSSKLPQTCFFCLRVISNRKQLREHQFTSHFKNVGEFTCPICSKLFIYRQQLKDHLISHSDTRQFVCKLCGLTCKRKSHLQKHMVTHVKERNYRCDVCHENFKVQADLKAHCFSAHQNQITKCNVCKHTLQTANSVYMHSMRHSGTRDHVCHVCGAGFKRKQHLVGHLTIHEKEKEKFQCPSCEKVFHDKKTLRKHLDQSHQEIAGEYQYDYKCAICNKDFAYKGRYDAHMKTHENETEEERLTYEVTKKVESISDQVMLENFKNFEKVTDEQKDVRLKCKLCKNREFRMISSATKHDIDHKKGRVKTQLFMCDLCNEEFVSKIKFRQHKLTHLSQVEKRKKVAIPVKSQITQCRKCNQTFKWKSCLQAHMSKCIGQNKQLPKKGARKRKATLKAIVQIHEQAENVATESSDEESNDNSVKQEIPVVSELLPNKESQIIPAKEIDVNQLVDINTAIVQSKMACDVITGDVQNKMVCSEENVVDE